ncbi:MAG: DedA family protein/thiosulfate sulfurtransferase GlpE, partial [Bacteroidota bacterium]
METVTASLQQYGVLLVFANVLLQQLGVPVPTLPTVVVAGALTVSGVISAPAVLVAATVASLAADTVWYAAGIRYGRPVLTTLCRISLSPDSCVRQSEDRLARWGPWALVIGKFVPGLSTVAPPVAGLVGLRPRTFALASTAAAALYFGLALALGIVFHDQVNVVLDAAVRHAPSATLALLALLAGYVAYRWLRRRQFARRLTIARVSVDELRQRIEAGAAPVILDVRSAVAREREPGIPGAVAASLNELEPPRLAFEPGREIVVYCSCPNEASAALVAQALVKAGFTNVRALGGGLDAWIAAGLPLAAPASAPQSAAVASGCAAS